MGNFNRTLLQRMLDHFQAVHETKDSNTRLCSPYQQGRARFVADTMRPKLCIETSALESAQMLVHNATHYECGRRYCKLKLFLQQRGANFWQSSATAPQRQCNPQGSVRLTSGNQTHCVAVDKVNLFVNREVRGIERNSVGCLAHW